MDKPELLSALYSQIVATNVKYITCQMYFITCNKNVQYIFIINVILLNLKRI